MAAASPSGSAGTAISDGSSARASVSRAPAQAPRSAAAWVTAWMIGPCVPSTVRTTGSSGAKSLDFAPALHRQVRQPDGKHPPHGRCSSGRADARVRGTAPPARPKPRERAGRRDWRCSGLLAIRQRIRAPLRFAVPPSRTSQQGTPAALRRDRKPPRRGEVERRRVAPQLADHCGQAASISGPPPSPTARAGVPRLDMDEFDAAEARAGRCARFRGSPCGPAPRAKACPRSTWARRKPVQPASRGAAREQLGQGGAGWRGQGPARTQQGRVRRRSGRGGLGRSGARGDGSAGDERQAFRHTTHNVSVLLLFFFSRLGGESQCRELQRSGIRRCGARATAFREARPPPSAAMPVGDPRSRRGRCGSRSRPG